MAAVEKARVMAKKVRSFGKRLAAVAAIGTVIGGAIGGVAYSTGMLSGNQEDTLETADHPVLATTNVEDAVEEVDTTSRMLEEMAEDVSSSEDTDYTLVGC